MDNQRSAEGCLVEECRRWMVCGDEACKPCDFSSEWINGYNIQLSDAGFGPGLVHKIDRDRSAADDGYETTICGIRYACGTITYDEVNCPECCDHNWIDYAKISYPGLKFCTKCDKMKQVEAHAPMNAICEKCGRRYCDHENKY